MDNIKDVVNKVISQLSQETIRKNAKINDIWLKIIEQKDAKHVKIVSIKNNKIIVNVDSSTRLYYMHSQKTVILKKIKTHIANVNDIVFKIGNI